MSSTQENGGPGASFIRAYASGLEVREAEEREMPDLVGRFAVFNEWTEIRSIFEGRFMERFAPGAFKKTFRENRKRLRVLFQHGRDPQVGDKPLGTIEELREESDGAHYRVPLFDTNYNRELLPALKAGQFGASFRFTPVKVVEDTDPKRSDHNPDGLPERTITEARVSEFGPVTFPAYEGATAGVRSMMDEFLFEHVVRSADSERLRQLVEFVESLERARDETEGDDTEGSQLRNMFHGDQDVTRAEAEPHSEQERTSTDESREDSHSGSERSRDTDTTILRGVDDVSRSNLRGL